MYGTLGCSSTEIGLIEPTNTGFLDGTAPLGGHVGKLTTAEAPAAMR